MGAKLTLVCSAEQYAGWREAAYGSRLSLSAWARRMLDEAAENGVLVERGGVDVYPGAGREAQGDPSPPLPEPALPVSGPRSASASADRGFKPDFKKGKV